MKKVFISILLLGSFFAGNAQKNTVLVGGNISLESQKEPGTLDDAKSTAFVFGPTIGYQFNDNWTAGIVANISTNKYTEGSSEEKKLNLFSAGPFIRYAKPLSSMFAVYGQLEGKFGGSKYTTKSGSITTTAKGTTAEINLFPALFIDFKNSFGLNFSIGGISYISSKPKGGESTNNFKFTFGQTVGIGVSKNFGGKK